MDALRYPLAKTTVAAAVAAFAVALVGAGPAHAAPAVWDRVAACESGGNWRINTGNGFYGGLQFTRSTWLAFGGGAYASNAHLASKAAQILVAQRTLAAQGPGAWPVCSVRAGLTRANGARTTVVSRNRVRVPLKLNVDGKMGPATRAAMARKGIFWNTKAAIRAWQARLRVKVDGKAGPRTIASMQRWLNTH